ncbi:GNAT family N-acetyltransferase [Oceanispirochaeta crateris]|nr:GNAT family N-acetyltransferase [Oceanispirochaeta crateris]
MKYEIEIIPSKQEHQDEVLQIFNDGFSSKFQFVTQNKDQQLSFARDFALFHHESQNLNFVAVLNGHVAGFLLLKLPIKHKSKSKKGLSNHELLRKYGLLGIVKTILLGATFYHKIKEGEAYIDTLGVAPKYRGKGVGTQLINFAESIARQKGLSRLSLLVIYENPKAQKLYESCGFQVKSSHSHWWMKRSTGISGSYYMEKEI